VSFESDPGIFEFSVTASGSAVAPEVLGSVVELVVDARLRVPDRLALRLRDDELSVLDAGTFAVGTAVTVSMSAANGTDHATVFDGQVTTLAPEFDDSGVTLNVLALDRGCLLQRGPRSATYQQMSYGAIAEQLASAAGLSSGSISSGLTLPFVQQSNETDWAFLWRLALELDYEVKVTGSELNFRGAGSGSAGSPVKLAVGELLRSFTPRVTGVGQVDSVTVRGWDPSTAEAIVGTASPGTTQSQPGIARSTVAGALGTGTATVVDHPVNDLDHANELATGIAARIANAYVEGEGRADAVPSLVPGGLVQIAGVGDTFSGSYAVSGVRHVLRADSGFETQFTIAGREDRSLLGLTRTPPAAELGWAHRIVVGRVTNVEDPDELGRVRVAYPALDDQHEGWWARVVAPGAGVNRGFLTLPLVGDEVLVAFEHGSDQHPYVLGSVYNGQAKPGELVTKDGSYYWASSKAMTFTAVDKVALTGSDTLTLTSVGKATLTTKPGDDEKGAGDIDISAKGSVAISSEKDTTISPKGDLTMSADGSGTLSAKASLTLSADQSATVSGEQSLTLSGGTTVSVSSDGELEISGEAVKITSTGPLQISAPQVLLG